MDFKNRDSQKLTDKSLIELARLIIIDERRAMNFNDIFSRVADLKGLTEEQRKVRIGQFYTDLNLDGHFVTTGANNWGLKSWYKVDRLPKEEPSRLLPKKVNRRRIVDNDDIDLNVEGLSMIDGSEDDMEAYDEYDDDLFESGEIDVDS